MKYTNEQKRYFNDMYHSADGASINNGVKAIGHFMKFFGAANDGEQKAWKKAAKDWKRNRSPLEIRDFCLEFAMTINDECQRGSVLFARRALREVCALLNREIEVCYPDWALID